MRAQSIRARLRDGPATWADLAAVSGYDEHRCMIEVNRLQRECGCTIEARQITELRLVYDPENPVERTCGWPGCEELLRLHNGTGFCAAHVQAEAKRRWLAMTPEEREALAVEVCGGEADVLVLLERQLTIEGLDQ